MTSRFNPERTASSQFLLSVLNTLSRRVAGGERSALPPAEGASALSDGEFFAFAPSLDTPIPAGVSDARGWSPENKKGRHAWGGFANGHIPTESLTSIGGNFHLEGAAAAAFLEMREAAAQDGVTITLSSAYRDYDTQVRLREEKGHQVATATPGHSVHGWGRAIDVRGAEAQRWLRENGPTFGFIWPDWAQQPGKAYEPWHFEFSGTRITPAVQQSPTSAPAETQPVSRNLRPE